MFAVAASGTFLLALCVSAGWAAAEPQQEFTSPAPAAPEYGNGLTPDQADQGWISLFDGSTSFGWTGGRVEKAGRGAALVGDAATTSEFGDYQLRVDTPSGGDLSVGAGARKIRPTPGTSERTVEGFGRGPIRLGKGLAIRALLVRPLKLSPVLAGGSAGETLRHWKVVPHESLPPQRQAKWEELRVGSGGGGPPSGLRAIGGPGCVELPGTYDDFVLQLTVRVRRPLANAGLFFRCMPGVFLDGYEAQIFNGCYGHDPARPAEYATGAIDDRQNARRLISRDDEPFSMTIIAVGPHTATWINGAQVTDWTDARKPNENARKGLRLEPGPIQLQAHDKNTDVEFRDIRVGVLDRNQRGERRTAGKPAR
jgi:hypothetical protein